MIRARGLRRTFGRLVAVDDISLEVPDGTLLALLGPNGAGKTTTVRMLAGLLAPSAGEASVDGLDVRVDAAAIRARVGLVADSPGLHDRMTPVAYLDFFGRVYGLDARTRRRRIDELLDLFELQDFRAARMAGFSRGMQQKVALARALLHEPSSLFLDEPTAGLDPLSARVVRDMIVGLKQASRSIVLCTHDLDEAERLADTVAILRHGRIVAADTPAALRAGASSETLVEVSLAAACPEAANIAARVPGVTNPRCSHHPVDPEAWLLAFTTSHPRQTNPQVVSTLAAAGARIISLTCSTASLEDVYTTALAHRPVAFNGIPAAARLPGASQMEAGRELAHNDEVLSGAEASGYSTWAPPKMEAGSMLAHDDEEQAACGQHSRLDTATSADRLAWEPRSGGRPAGVP